MLRERYRQIGSYLKIVMYKTVYLSIYHQCDTISSKAIGQELR